MNELEMAAYDEGYNEGKKQGYDEGYEEGREDGYHEGQDQGYNNGWDEGREEGYSDGYSEGRADRETAYDTHQFLRENADKIDTLELSNESWRFWQAIKKEIYND